MPYSEPTNLGVVACPGGAVFADEVIAHLRHPRITNTSLGLVFEAMLSSTRKKSSLGMSGVVGTCLQSLPQCLQ